MAEQLPLKRLVGGSSPPGLTGKTLAQLADPPAGGLLSSWLEVSANWRTG